MIRESVRLTVSNMALGKPFFGSVQLRVAEMGGRAPKKRENARIRSARTVDDQNWSKITRPKKSMHHCFQRTAGDTHDQSLALILLRSVFSKCERTFYRYKWSKTLVKSRTQCLDAVCMLVPHLRATQQYTTDLRTCQ